MRSIRLRQTPRCRREDRALVGVRRRLLHELLPPASLLGHELGSLEHRYVLLDRGEAHRVAAGELGDALLLVQHDATMSRRVGVGERVEEPVIPAFDSRNM